MISILNTGNGLKIAVGLFKREEIARFYPRAHPNLDLGPYEYSVDYWKKQNPSYTTLPFDEDVIWNKIWQFSPPTRFGTKYKDAIVNAKNIHLYTYANVVNISAAENVSAITEMTVKNYTGKQHTVRAKYFILACCAIQNSRLMLASNLQAKAGIGNDNDLVGRYFMEHPELKTGELWLTNSNELSLYRFGQKIRAELAISAQKQKELKVLNGTISLDPLMVARRIESNVKTWNQDDPRKSLEKSQENWGNAQKKGVVQRLLAPVTIQSFELYTRIEQVPNPSSRVVLSNEKDSLGVPRANLHWALSPIDKRTVRKLNELIGQQVGIKGIGRVRLYDFLRDESDTSMPDSTSGGWHHMGTTRISDDPKKGVVDANCKVHGIDNLYVAGSSCFPTVGSVNPTLTLVALTIRLSDHIKTKV